MDRKKLLQLKEALLKGWVPVIIIATLYMIIPFFTSEREIYDISFIFLPILIFIVPYLILYLVLSLIIKIKKIPKIIKIEGYNRELPFNYSPAIVSALCDNYVEGLVDIEAVKTNLLIKGIKNASIKDIQNLSQHELYVWKRWGNSSVKEFKKLLYSDMEKLGLIKIKKVNEIVRFLTGFFVIIAISIGIMRINSIFHSIIFGGIGFIFMLLSLLLILPFSLALFDNLKIKQTKLGREHTIEWLKFKNFLEDFTLLNEREKESVIIYKEYIPYSMAVGIGEKIEKDIFAEYWEELFMNN